MKITQMKFQKMAVTFALITAVLTFVYSYAIFSTDFYPMAMYFARFDRAGQLINGQLFYDYVQDFNRTIATLSLIFILVTVTLFIFQNQKRRRYYVTNYITTGLFSGFAIYYSVYSLINIANYSSVYANIDFQAVIDSISSQTAKANFIKDVPTSTPTFVIGFVLFILVFAAAVLLVVNAIWKYKSIKAEDALYAEEDEQIRARKAEKERLLAEDL